MSGATFAFMAPLMFAGLVVILLLGYPVAFALAANGLLFAFVGIQSGFFDFSLLQALPERVYGIVSNQTLLAIPFFTFMGLVLERSGMAEELLDTIGQLFGRVRGGLAYAVVLVGALLAATTGVMAASVIAMGLISLPIMLRYGYDKRLASGVITASGTLAQIVPPSIVLIVLADQLGVSVGDMYTGALAPGLTLAGLYLLYVLGVTLVKPDAVPALPPQARRLRGAALAQRAAVSLIPPLVLIFLVLGTIFLGVATPTEGGALGAAGAVVLAALRRRLTLDVLKQAMDSTARLTSFVIFILIGSTVFSLVFRGVDGDLWVESLLTHLPGGVVGFLVVVNLLVFSLAFFLDFFEIAFIVVPLLAPVAAKLGIDPIWFGVLLGINMQTSFLHPPFGFALFYLRSVAPKSIRTADIYWGAVPFVGLQILMVVIVIAFPQIVGHAPIVPESEIVEVPLEADPGAGYLPPEWR
ncbi:MAG: C4-dicarboxylate ABC transporter [Candidatus Muproteobacteria bacterium RIFCSPHIGHO2_12_FULL_60_33]|nr:MAG: C4-dicarboxylate ABC transporter [Candidatus Muproteobacteria bacterium RIFCSPHIGHO2_12_FULL_60_33]OGI55859.1 MAG: C4-dicarboxylate ABC transporter [Candidatus Muproteobacteria bacterium RIFCSPHIGHO2_02_FULL_60_13]OGI59312.1 MAG: C4-dicarboxylate ABC transporter [Candidatus Muproteobacteria bacterium RIFCSPHIGHO2_01_FULL_61_200]